MATSISSLGVGSGLDLSTLLQQLRTAENIPLAALATRTSAEKQRLSAYGTIKSSLESLVTAASALGKSGTFTSLKATTTGDTFAAVTKENSNAVPGNHSVLVKQLATAQVMASGRATTSDQAVSADASGTVNIHFTQKNGSEHTISVEANASLQSIAKAINQNDTLGFNATIMNDGVGFRLIVTSQETGEQHAISSITASLNDGGSGDISALKNVLDYDASSPSSDGMTETVAGRNANVLVNGVEVVSQKNLLENVIEGVSLTLTKQAAEDAQPDSLQVARDDSVAVTAAENFVKAYNSLQNQIKSLTAYNIEEQKGAPLTGDSLARRVQTQMRESINGLVSNSVTLSSIGITTDPATGELRLDKQKFTSALSDHRTDVQQLFTGENGLGSRVTAAAEAFMKDDGLLKTSQQGIEKTIRQLERQYEQMESRIDAKMETYRAQFVQLDNFIAQMNGVSSYLTQQLAMLGNLNKGAK
ncbi:flagellar filament capping protein FliD [bacterium SGD-2]|nr:flagellar filament capping protein FliD [bacterium SGD-2]